MNASPVPIKVLVVEDSDDMLFIMQTELEWLGYKVYAVRNALSGLEVARTELPDIILSDIHMPGTDGFEFVRRLREIPALTKVPAIALSGFGREKDIQDALANGFTAHLTKPVEPTHLVALIQKLTGKKKVNRAS